MLELRNDTAAVALAPETGGALLGWLHGSTPVLRRALPDAMMRGDVRGFSAFPLLPFCNRIGYARFTWQGQEYRLNRNFGDEPHAIHGVGWQRGWAVQDASRESVTLALHHDAAGAAARAWPFAFDATLSYRLAADALLVSLAVTSRHDAAAPAGIGLHPFFPRTAGVALQFQADGVWLNGDDALPLRHEAVPPAWDHAAGREIGSVVLDNCFTGWTRRAQIRGLAGGVTITADDAFRHLQVFTPPGRDFFCVEAVSHVPNALDRPDLPPAQAMRVLQPGETLAGGIRFLRDT
jgi:aldose 1-epimerase